MMRVLALLLAAAPAAAQPCDPLWQTLGEPIRGDVVALAVYDEDGPGGAPPVLIAAGCIADAGGEPLQRIARWDGAAWSTVGGGVDGPGLDCVLAMTVWDPDGPGPERELLIVAGQFTTAGGISANRIAAWDGERWHAMGAGFNDWVMGLAVVDHDGPGPMPPTLYACGRFTASGATPIAHVARWTGSAWQQLGTGLDNVGTALHGYDPDGAGPQNTALYVGGDFVRAGGLFTPRLARWTGAVWQPIGASGFIRDMELWDPDGPGPLNERLVVAGDLQEVAGVPVRSIAAYDGTTWSNLDGGTLSSRLGAVGSFPLDPAQPEFRHLLASEQFSSVGYHEVWDGTSWQLEFYETFQGSAYDYASFDVDGDGAVELVAGGTYSVRPGGAPSRVIYRKCESSGCRADLDGDGELTFFDFLMFQNLFAAGDPRADWDGDGKFTFFDFLGFQDSFAAGCP